MFTRYYYIIDGQEFGPYYYGELMALSLPSDTKVRCEGCISETTLSEILKSRPLDDNNNCVKVTKDFHSDFRFFTKDK